MYEDHQVAHYIYNVQDKCTVKHTSILSMYFSLALLWQFKEIQRTIYFLSLLATYLSRTK